MASKNVSSAGNQQERSRLRGNKFINAILVGIIGYVTGKSVIFDWIVDPFFVPLIGERLVLLAITVGATMLITYQIALVKFKLRFQ